MTVTTMPRPRAKTVTSRKYWLAFSGLFWPSAWLTNVLAATLSAIPMLAAKKNNMPLKPTAAAN